MLCSKNVRDREDTMIAKTLSTILFSFNFIHDSVISAPQMIKDLY